MNIVSRNWYLQEIEKYFRKDTIIILTGQRRVGKSYILRMFRDRLATQQSTNVIYIDKEKKAFDTIKHYTDLNAYIDANLVENVVNYVLIDEIQDVEHFEKSLRNYYEEPNIELIITGSNSNMLSSDLSTIIGGRYKEIHVNALSYNEFMQFHKLPDSDETLSTYIQYGGLPGLLKMGLDVNDAAEYQKDVFHTVLLKDVVMRNQIRNVPFLENLVYFLADNAGKVISANSIAKYMKSQGDNITTSLIINYIKFLCDAYIVQKVNRYDIKGKRLFESADKYYFSDHGIRNALVGGRRENDIEKVLENIVYNELKHLGYSVMVGDLQAGEIDFVCTKPTGQRVYIQVCYLIADEATRNREFGNLKRIKDNYPKYVISVSPFLQSADYDGITHLHLRHFLTHGLV